MIIRDELMFIDKSDTKEDLIKGLKERNERWIGFEHKYGDYNNSLNTIILTCVDSRVPVEKIFNLKPGEALVIRNAGNLIDQESMRSILLGIFEIHVKFVIIMGHTRCGCSIRDNKETVNELMETIPQELKNELNLTTEEEILDWFGLFNHNGWDQNVMNNCSVLKKKLGAILDSGIIPEIIPAIYDLDLKNVIFLEEK